MFANLAVDAFGGPVSGRVAPRLFGLAAPATLLSGLYLGARFGVLTSGWMCASYVAIAIMAGAGIAARRSDALRPFSLRVSTGSGLAVVFLMIAKPGPLMSLVVIGVALVLTITALPATHRETGHLSSANGV